MKFTAECGCEIELPLAHLPFFIKGVGHTNPKILNVCEQHQYEMVLSYLKTHGSITVAQFKDNLKITNDEALILLKKVKNNNDEMFVIFNNFTLSYIE